MFQLPITSKNLLLSALLLLFVTIAPVVAQEKAIVRLDPPSLTLRPGETGQVTVWVDNVANMVGAEIHLTYNPDLVEVVDADSETQGVQVAHGEFMMADFVAQNLADASIGNIDYAVASMPPHEPSTGSGPLTIITLRGRQDGEAMLTVQNVLLAATGGESIVVSWDSAQTSVIVSSDQPQTSTPLACGTTGALILSVAAAVFVQHRRSLYKKEIS